MNIIKSDIVSLHGTAISMIGGRPENQDDMAYLDTPLGFLVIVCDGMGGGPGGKTASFIVKHEIAETICECSPQTPRDHALKMAAARAHQALEEKMKENPALCGMGSTFVAALLNSQSAIIAHSGDSRCYRLHGKKCLFRTQDHSLVAELVRKKVMTEEEARQSPQANVITRGLGSTNNHVPEIDEIPYRKGDRFVLCTDGVWGSMPHQKLIDTFAQPLDLQKLLSDISTRVDKIGFLKGGGHDNHTIAVFELEKDSQLREKVSLEKKLFIAVILLLVFVCLAFLCMKGYSWMSKTESSNSQQGYSGIRISGSTNEFTIPEEKEAKEHPSSGDKLNQDSGAIVNSINNNDTAKWEIDAIVSSDYVDEQRKDTLVREERKQQPTKSKVMSKNKDIPQDIIDCLSKAKEIRDKDLKTAQKQMSVIHNTIVSLTDSLVAKVTNKRVLHEISEFKKNISQEKLWWINGTKDSEGFYCALYPNAFEKYSIDMANIKKLLKENKK